VASEITEDERASLLATEDEILEHCTHCHGSGYDPDGTFNACDACRGGGTQADVERERDDWDSFFNRL